MEYKENLIIDVGAHIGVDTEYYLLKGFNVVAVEANPLLAEELEKKFKKDIDEKRLQVMNIGISDKEGEFEFYVNLKTDEWSSFVKEVGARDNTPYKTEIIKCTTFDKILEQTGIPYYLKIDIETYDTYCVQALHKFEKKPKYISVEATTIDLVFHLRYLGYRGFKLMNQALLRYKGDNFHSKIKNEQVKWKYGMFSSGPFGEEVPGNWLDYEQVLKKLLNRKKGILSYNPLFRKSWYDLHGKLGE